MIIERVNNSTDEQCMIASSIRRGKSALVYKKDLLPWPGYPKLPFLLGVFT